jgi:hypothetical protein
MNPRSGIIQVSVATFIGGGAGYLTTFLTYSVLGPVSFVYFSAFWATLYFIVGSLSGIQQEVARASGSEEMPQKGRTVSITILATTMSIFFLVFVFLVLELFTNAYFDTFSTALVMALCVGAGSYVLVAFLSGSLYGQAKWRLIAFMITIDGILRLGLISLALLFTQDIEVLAWCLVLPFPLALVLILPFLRIGTTNGFNIKLETRKTIWNISRTLSASIALAITVNALPLLVFFASRGNADPITGELMFAVTILRAPLVVASIALQSYFLVYFSRTERHESTANATPFLVLSAATVLLTLFGFILGSRTMNLITGDESLLSNFAISIIFLSSGFIAILVAASSMSLSRGFHATYSTSWLTTSALTVFIILQPGDLISNVLTAIALGPLAGIAVVFSQLFFQRLKNTFDGEAKR